MADWYEFAGLPYPLGVSWHAPSQKFNFAFYSRYATGVTLQLFTDDNPDTSVYSVELDPLKHRTGRVWHIRINPADIQGATLYGYRVKGPMNPLAGHRFDTQKLLLDPFAKAVFFPPGFNRNACSLPGNTQGKAPLGVILADIPAYDWTGDIKPRHHQHDLVIYEMHTRGFTKSPSSGLSDSIRGTFAGIIAKIPHLKELGVTAVELMPVQQFDPQEVNYWGYMTLNFFSLHQAYTQSADPFMQINEFRDMVKALHQADIEVILDVVYNHTSESGVDGPTYSFRGIDNLTYYLLRENRSEYNNDSGTGNVLNSANRHVRQLIIESLRYWVKEMHVDGFRFDLASIFSRQADGSINLEDSAIIDAISADPDFQSIRLIAEAWDIGSYQLGSKFPGITWMQWNGEFRDTARRFVKSDAHQVPAMMAAVYGSDYLFPDRLPDVYHPYQSVNFLTAHDGFCLYDLVSYNQKYNYANGHNNTDGTNANYSWNHGWEGDQQLPSEILSFRKQQIKNLAALLMLSNGTPMILMGDEFLNTQLGNNNPYNQDNATSWLDWNKKATNSDIFRFWQILISFRKSHPSISRSRFWREDVQWFGVLGGVDLSADSRCFAYFLNGAKHDDINFYVMVNAYWEPLVFHIQAPGPWFLIVNTAAPSPNDIVAPGQAQLLSNNFQTLAPRSLVVLQNTA